MSVDIKEVVIDRHHVTIEEVVAVIRGCKVRLTDDPDFLRRIKASNELLTKFLKEGRRIYGVTTSLGDAVTTELSPEYASELGKLPIQCSGCGMGAFFEEGICRAILFTRVLCLSKGFSGIRMELVRQMELFLQNGVTPLIPEEGSVGASGDIVPMSYVAAVLCGERKVYYQGEIRSTADVLKELDIRPLTLGPKEGLSLINSTTVMSSVACLVWKRAEYFSRLASRATALATLGLMGNREHFHPNLYAVRKHKGPALVAKWVYGDLKSYTATPARMQDRYSIRCSPLVLGVLRDALVWMKDDIENEFNTVNDNPIFNVDEGMVYYGGHFYGGYIAFAMDSLAALVASVADMLDRQLALMVDTRYSNGLPSNLSGASDDLIALNLGFKNFQIAVSSFTAEAIKLTFPASVLSRSTESHNQDKVSMGTISARYALRVLTLAEQVLAGVTTAAVQAVDLRLRDGTLSHDQLGTDLSEFFKDFRKHFQRVVTDRPLDNDLRQFVKFIHEERWSLYE